MLPKVFGSQRFPQFRYGEVQANGLPATTLTADLVEPPPGGQVDRRARLRAAAER